MGTDQGFGGLTGSVYALNRFTGQLAWSRRLDPGFATDLAVYDSLVLGVTLDDRILSFHGTNGERQWETSAGWVVDTELINYEDVRSPVLTSSCVITGDHVGYAGRDDSVHALSAGTGESVWTTDAGGSVTARPCAAGPDWVIGNSNYRLVFLNAESGRLDRSIRTPLIPEQSMAWNNGRLYFLGGFEDLRPEDLLCMDTRTHEIVWHRAIPDTTANAFWYVPRLHLWDGAVIVGSTHGLVVAYDEVTGEIAWQLRLESAIRGIGSSTEMLFVGNFDGKLYGLRKSGAGR